MDVIAKNVLKSTTNTREKAKNFLEKTVFAPYVEKKSCLVMKKCVLHVDKKVTKEESQLQKNREQKTTSNSEKGKILFISKGRNKGYVQDVERENLRSGKRNAEYALPKILIYIR